MSPLTTLANVPFDINVLSSVFPETKHITEKARKLVSDGKITVSYTQLTLPTNQ